MTQTKYDALVQAVANAHEAQIYDGPAWDVMKAAAALVDESPTAADVSDGYHTANDLYRHRMLLNAALFNTWHRHLPMLGVHKSKRHSDGDLPFGGGWFIVVADLPTGQISYHYELEHWDLFDIEEYPQAREFDGHTSEQVETRIEGWLTR